MALEAPQRLLTRGGACRRPSVGGGALQVFGLGNKTYEHYNSMGKFWDAKLAELGANRVFELGLGDDDGKYVPRAPRRWTPRARRGPDGERAASRACAGA